MVSPERMTPRAAKLKLDHAQDCLAYLEFARRAKGEVDGNWSGLDATIAELTTTVEKLSGQANQRIEPRRRVRVTPRTEHSAPRHEYFVFLDECGTHTLDADRDPFPVFCLCAVLVDKEGYERFDRVWKTWKASWLGSWQLRIHEPDLRRRSDSFHHDDPTREQAIVDALAAQLSDLDFTCIAAAIDKRKLKVDYPDGRVDDFLPMSHYLMCVDFVLERVVHFLYEVGNDAEGLVVAEARGLREDAEVHAEFLRLHLSGTQYITDRYFRNQLRPYIEFKRKDRNESGLQIADLVARPIAEKVLRPTSIPERWQTVASKIYGGQQGRRGSYGLKVFPATSGDMASFFREPAFKANEDAKASPPTDPQVRVHNGDTNV